MNSLIRSYFVTAFRNILKRKGYSIINITGLSLGIACCIIIMLWVQDELNYDRFHENRDQIYRVNTKYRGNISDKSP